MHIRTLVIERDDPAEPGLLLRRYARIGVCWDPSLGDWGWMRFNAAGQVLGRVEGPFPASEAAFEDAQLRLGGQWEGVETAAVAASAI
jgi:hypothetical protein